MSECENESLPNLELKIVNMLDKLIEADEELEKNEENNLLKFNADISDSEDEKIFEKNFINPSFQNEENNKLNSSKSLSKNFFQPRSSQNETNAFKNNTFNVNNSVYNNYPFPCFYNSFPQQINNYPKIRRPSNSNIISNSTTSFSSNCDNNNNIYNQNSNASYIFSYNNNNLKDNNSLINYGIQDFNNSFYAGDKNCFNQNNKDTNLLFKNNNIFNSNVELEILLIEVKKILNKSEKIDQTIYNKLKGKFDQIIRTHKGSRIFQNYLKNSHADILHQIFLELKNKLTELLKDNYANYFCKRFFCSLNQKDRIEFLTIIQNDLGSLAIDFTATYPIQGIIEQLGSKAEKKIIKEIIDYAIKNFIDLSYHINGICIIKKLLLMTHKKDLHTKIKKIIYDNAINLIVHQYGNYVIQTIVENWDDKELEDIINIFRNKYIYLSKQKYSSNAIERIIEKNQKNLIIYINEICNENNFIEIIKNKYGNYVIQKAVKLSSGIFREKIIGKISKNINKLEDKKIINKWKAIIYSKLYN